MTSQSTDDGATSWREEVETVEGDERGRSRVTQQPTDDSAMRQQTNDGTTRQSTDDGATMSWREEAEAVEGDERGRSHVTQQSTEDGATRNEGADEAQGKEDGLSLLRRQ